MIVSCRPKREDIEKVGLLKTYELRRSINSNGINGKIQGSFFIGCGSIDGNLSTERQLQFEWSRDINERIITTLPYGKFLFIIDSTKINPTIQFIFEKAYLNEESGNGDNNQNFDPNPNNYLYGNIKFQQVIVRISKKDYEQEIYLQR